MPLVDVLEPEAYNEYVKNQSIDTDRAIALSQAISLKRIADLFEEIVRETEELRK